MVNINFSLFLNFGGESKRIAVGVHDLMARDWDLLLAALVIVISPPMIFCGLVQNYITEAFAMVGGKKDEYYFPVWLLQFLYRIRKSI